MCAHLFFMTAVNGIYSLISFPNYVTVKRRKFTDLRVKFLNFLLFKNFIHATVQIVFKRIVYFYVHEYLLTCVHMYHMCVCCPQRASDLEEME